MIQIFLDGDWVCYTAGFAGQKVRYLAPEISMDEFDNMTEVKNEARAQRDGEADTGPVYSRTIVDPLDHILHSAKHMIESQVIKIQERWPNENVGLTVFLDGDGNFRNRVATIKPYKGNRVTTKPVAFAEIRQYLLDNWNAQLVHDMESDDAMAIAQTAYKKGVIVAVDKDMLQVPGQHLNPNKGFKKVSKRGGLHRLYVQAAQGDPTDNIGGAYRVGPKAAAAAFEDDIKSEQEYWDRLVEVYALTIEKYGDEHYGGLSAEMAALENMRLVYLKRKLDEPLWMPPGAR